MGNILETLISWKKADLNPSSPLGRRIREIAHKLNRSIKHSPVRQRSRSKSPHGRRSPKPGTPPALLIPIRQKTSLGRNWNDDLTVPRYDDVEVGADSVWYEIPSPGRRGGRSTRKKY